jgi:hypothetical protein
MEDYEVGVNESEPAEQTEASEPEVTTEETEGNTEGTESEVTEEQPELDRNAIYADARRKAEAEARRKQSAIDAEYAERFKDYKNPITGQPIKSAKDYFDALTAQEQLQTKKTLADNGIDPNLIEKAVNNSPAVKAANLVIAEQRLEKVKTYLDEQVKEVGKIDPDIRTVQDIEKSDRYPQILAYVNNNRLSVVDAYKLVYADKLNEKKTAAVKQQTINNAKSQQHLKSTEGGNGGADGLVNIPESQLAEWKRFYPEKSAKELKEAYNRSLHK